MEFRGRDQALTLNIVGYQFPDADDPDKRFSWHMIDGSAVCAEGGWTFRWQALTCEESVRLSVWLKDVADWLDRDRSGTVAAPSPPWLTEPNLAFSVDRGDAEAEGTLHVGLDREFRPPWSTVWHPYQLRIPVTAQDLRDAATAWDADLARYPDGLAV